ncbi:MAG: proline--tRNA ligase [Candidatus Aminicenantes bacterium]|nr:proline--tRNA ligase [Candidatus Aminicenantes bacterium]
MEKTDDFVKQITKKSEDFSRWYTDVIKRAKLADYAPIKGVMVIRPYGYEIWELIRDQLDRMFKDTGHQNAYFPLLIPESLLKKEAEHVEGFAPEVAWVTMGGSEPLEERLAIRPTSEAIICSMYAKWIKSWRDLPLKINQWANIVRWEKVTRPFLRTTEFLWQEGHTAHASCKEAEEETLSILEIYKTFIEKYLAIPVITGLKSDSEKFAGALKTYCVETLMPDGKSLQAGTSHHLGQNFSKAFGIRFENKNQELEYAWQTSWGVTTRLIGALVMVHGDDSGLILPPEISPVQTVIVPISRGDWKETILPQAENIYHELKQNNIRVILDDRDTYTPGWKFSEWEVKGVPVRLELGPKDLEKKQVVLVNRINRDKKFVPVENLVETLKKLLADIQSELLSRARAFNASQTHIARTESEIIDIIETRRGLVKTAWCGSPQCEIPIKEKASATIRAILDQPDSQFEKCAICGKAPRHTVIFAKSY